jgi:osmotically-inducible protein OsmY
MRPSLSAAIAERPTGDARLASEVQSALAAEPALRGSSISVHSEDGVVTLRGATSDTERRILAAHVARAVQGVRLVRNELAEAGKA